MIKPEIDAEFSSLIPPLSAEEYMQLEANLLAEGCRDPLVVWGDTLIDGHNRLKICEKHGIEFQVTRRQLPDREAAIEFIIRNQFGRRNLSAANRSLLALRLEPILAQNAKKRMLAGKRDPVHNEAQGKTRDQVAKLAGVSHSTIDRVKMIMEHGTPEQMERVKKGDKGNSVYSVYKEVAQPSDAVPDVDDINPAPLGVPIENAGRDSYARTDCGEKNELEQIRGYVAELKNPDLNRSFTADMFLAEYEAFAQRFIRGIGTFSFAPYKEMYPLFTDADKKRIQALNCAMSEAIRLQGLFIYKE